MASSVRDIAAQLSDEVPRVSGAWQEELAMSERRKNQFANEMLHDLLGEPTKTPEQETKDAEFADTLIDEYRLTPLES